MKRHPRLTGLLFLVTIVNWSLVGLLSAADLELPMTVPRLDGLAVSFPVGEAGIVSIDLTLRYDEKGKVVPGGPCVVDGAPVEVKGVVKRKNGVTSYKLALKSREQKLAVKLIGELGEGPPTASIKYRGPKGKVARSNAVTLTAAAVVGALTLSPEVDEKGRISGTGVLASGFGNDPDLPGALKGKLKGDRLSWSLKSRKQKLVFKGERSGDVFVGVLKIKAPPEKSVLSTYTLPDIFDTTPTDTTPPEITAVVDPPPNPAGWNNTQVTVSFDCSDAESGIASCPAPIVVSAEGAAQTIDGTAIDGAGNQASASATVNLDRTSPLITNVFPADGATIGALEVTLSGGFGDALSGIDVASASIVLDGNPIAASLDVTESGFASPSPVTLAAGAHTLVVNVSDRAGNAALGATSTFTLDESALPPDPADVATPIDPTVAFSLAGATAFLYTGASPIQTGVAPGTIERTRAAVLRGRVTNRAGEPIPGVAIRVLGHPEYGRTRTREDGVFDMAVNGGGALVVDYVAEGYLPAQRRVDVSWQSFGLAPDVVMIPLDGRVTTVDLGAPGLKVARGSEVTDDDGTRTATVLIPEGTSAELVLPDGSTRPISTLAIRATEFTKGESGPAAMPAELPPASAYTYALEYTVDEALAANATSVRFDRAVVHYVEDFIGFPVGSAVPTGYYDRAIGNWVASENGRVVEILDTAGGVATLDTDGDEAPDDAATLAVLGVTEAERERLAALYPPGQVVWRVPLTHFTPWDCNWPYRFPDDADTPPDPWDRDDDDDADRCRNSNFSSVEVQKRVLREAVRVRGTPVTLHYRSDRVRGNDEAYTLQVNLTDDAPPASLKSVHLSIQMLGRSFNWSYEDLRPFMTQRLVWDGIDIYGRKITGSAPALVQLTYTYPAVYEPVTADFLRSFGRLSPGGFTALSQIPARQEILMFRRYVATLSATDVRDARGYGGWTLSLHHAYDPAGRVLEPGDGSWRSAASANGRLLSIAAGTGDAGFSGDDGPAIDARLHTPHAFDVAPDGTLFIADTINNRIRAVSPDGIITTAADLPFPFDLRQPRGVVVGADGSIYFAEAGRDQVRKRLPDGSYAVVAGKGKATGGIILPCSTSGDDGPALEADVCSPAGLAIGPDGALLIAESTANRIRRVDTDGVITTIAGTGIPGLEGDGGLAIDAKLWTPLDVAVGPDGALYIADSRNNRIRRVSIDGVITTVAGGGFAGLGDGGPATAAELNYPTGVDVAADGSLVIADSGNGLVREVDPDGVIYTIAGGGEEEAGIWASRVLLETPHDVAYGPDGSVYVLERGNHRLDRVGDAFSGLSVDEHFIPSEDGHELYHFDASGRHLETLVGLTGAVKYAFAYDEAGYLVTVTDAKGLVTTIERAPDGAPGAIVGPFGDRTELALDDDGYLEAITGPDQKTHNFAYAEGGLLTSHSDPAGKVFEYEFDEDGRLTKTADPAGGFRSYALERSALGYDITELTAEGRETVYRVELPETGERILRKTYPDGTEKRIVTGADGTLEVEFGDGMKTRTVLGAEPRWGMDAPMTTAFEVETPGGIRMTVERERTVELASPGDPLALKTLTQTVTRNGRATTTVFDGESRRITETSPGGRERVRTIDEDGRTFETRFGQMASLVLTRDEYGRVESSTRGSGEDVRETLFMYDVKGRLETIVDALDRATTLERDAAGRIIRIQKPGGREALITYDVRGAVTSITPPGRSAHGFSMNAVRKLELYDPPGEGNHTTYEHNLDRQLTAIVRPGGVTLRIEHNDDGTIAKLVTPEHGEVRFAYDPATARASSMTATADGGITSTFAHDGALLTAETISGPFTGTVEIGYDADFGLASETVRVGGQSYPIAYERDADRVLTAAGELSLTRGAENGLLLGTTIGNVTTTREYNEFGELIEETAAFAGAPFYSTRHTRDRIGRITEKVESTGTGPETVFTYEYDIVGRLITETVTRDGSVVRSSACDYDLNGNRIAYTSGGSNIGAVTYNGEDQLLVYGGSEFEYAPAGERRSRTVSGATTTYDFDVNGRLREVTLPGAIVIRYLLDGAGRRIGRQVGGMLAQGFLYRGMLDIVAELDSSGALVSRFVHGSRSNVPEYMIRGGRTYRLICDHLGSVRRVIDAESGTLAQQIDYDAWGAIIADTNPGFQPFGFAGGVHDSQTGLVHFGAREYDPTTGRWLSKDPILFAGADSNLYTYVGNDSVNRTDRSGLKIDPCGPWRWDDLEELLNEFAEIDPDDLDELVKRGDELQKELEKLRKEFDELDLENAYFEWYDFLSALNDNMINSVTPNVPFRDEADVFRELTGLPEPNKDSDGYIFGDLAFEVGTAPFTPWYTTLLSGGAKLLKYLW